MKKFASKQGSQLILKDDGSYTFKMSKSEWKKVGQDGGWMGNTTGYEETAPEDMPIDLIGDPDPEDDDSKEENTDLPPGLVRAKLSDLSDQLESGEVDYSYLAQALRQIADEADSVSNILFDESVQKDRARDPDFRY
tara:strand:- start:518 stop:928 length:411 start_codon:yes stop_codon:yes gene_type:complete